MTPYAPERARRLGRRGAAIVTAAAMVATPLVPARSRARHALAAVVVGGLAAGTFADSARRWGVARSAVAAAAVGAGTALVESVGTRSGRPFGRYEYTDALQPQVVGVPAVVPAAWFAMAVPAREVAHAILGSGSTPTRRVVLGAAALTAWDLFLDPQMVGDGCWSWERSGRYAGIPASNYAGWLATSTAVMAALEVSLPVQRRADRSLVATYAAMAAMETLGFAAFFRRPVVALAGGLAMGGLAAAATARVLDGAGDG